MGIILSLLLALSLNQAEVENARQAQEANKTMDEQQVRIDMLSQRVKRLKQEKLELIHSNTELKEQVETKTRAKVEATKVSKEVQQVKSANKNRDGYESYIVTAYTAGYESTQKNSGDADYGITASGEKVKENYTLACPKNMKFGTKVYIPHFDKTFVCQDRGSKIVENHLDVYMANLKDALKFGRKELKVKIIE